jgi:hypothetical protein
LDYKYIITPTGKYGRRNGGLPQIVREQAQKAVLLKGKIRSFTKWNNLSKENCYYINRCLRFIGSSHNEKEDKNMPSLSAERLHTSKATRKVLNFLILFLIFVQVACDQGCTNLKKLRSVKEYL